MVKEAIPTLATSETITQSGNPSQIVGELPPGMYQGTEAANKTT
jgi:hypothetical protein